MSLSRVIGTFNRQRISLPYSPPLRVVRGENGERIIEGVKPFVDSLPNIPLGRKIGEKWIPYSKEERINLAADMVRKEERAIKRAAKGKPPVKVKKEKPILLNFRQSMAHIASSQSPIQTVKRDGKWVQVASDNLTAHIEAR